MSVAQTILNQLGGGRFRAMTGAKQFLDVGDGLRFRLPGSGGFTKEGINCVTVRLNGLDLYDVTYHKIRGTRVRVVAESAGLYADMLRADFEEQTGLRSSLGSMGRVTI